MANALVAGSLLGIRKLPSWWCRRTDCFGSSASLEHDRINRSGRIPEEEWVKTSEMEAAERSVQAAKG